MSAQWGYRIPVVVFVLGACSVYDPSLLATSSNLGGAGAGAGGQTGAEAGTSASAGTTAGAGEPELEAGAAGAGDAGAGAGGSNGSGGFAGRPVGGGGGGGGGGAAGASAGGAGTSGASAGGAGTAGSAAGTGGAGTPPEFELVDNMENGDSVIDSTNGRGGDWYAAHDLTPTGTQVPSPFQVTALAVSDSRYAVSHFAAMTSGMGFTDWGENLGFNLRLLNGPKHPSYNATAYCGVHFFAKTGAGASNKALLRVIDKNSHPDGGVCGGGGMPCYQYFQKQLTFSAAWQEYSVLFSDLTCAGWPPSLVLSDVFSVEFGLTANSKFEIWVDDVSFLKKPVSGVCPK